MVNIIMVMSCTNARYDSNRKDVERVFVVNLPSSLAVLACKYL